MSQYESSLSQRRQLSQLGMNRLSFLLTFALLLPEPSLGERSPFTAWGARTIVAVNLCPDERSISPSRARTSHRPPTLDDVATCA